MDGKKIKICLVGSSGGHLTHLYMLKPFWKNKERFWVTFNKEDARSILEEERMYPCYYPTNRKEGFFNERIDAEKRARAREVLLLVYLRHYS